MCASLSGFQRGAFLFGGMLCVRGDGPNRMSGEIFLRDYRTTDLDAMFRLDEVCFAEEFRFDRESLREFAEERNAVVRIAEKVCGEIVGFVIAHIERIGSEWRAYLVTLDVAPEHRQRGLARRLMREAEACALGAGVRQIQLHVFQGNEVAIRFYERLGYRRIRVRRGYYAAGLDAIVYSKDLPGL
jgi:ribosomal-protein-alanine N-acetyltransferase